MVQLCGNNLPKRQQHLNNQVNDAVARDVSYDELMAAEESSDVDRLFKIDLAAKHKDLDYILKTITSSDSLYVSRALKKATWLCDDMYSHKINTDYLHLHVIPLLSVNLVKKLLTAIAIHLKNELRAEDFYKYCVKTNKAELSNKFLISTSEAFRLNLIKTTNKLIHRETGYIQFLIGNSFTLLNAYLEYIQCDEDDIINQCSYLYTVSDKEYLGILEKYVARNGRRTSLGLRISKDIVTKHKDRVLANPKFYVNILNMNKLIRHSTADEIKLYLAGVLPNTVKEFWESHYYKQYQKLIEALPKDERYSVINKNYSDKYSTFDFDMLEQFYHQKYYTLMSFAEREDWALRHIGSGKEMLGSGNNFKWYRFVSFNESFPAIKKLIKTATEHARRQDLLKVLAESAKTQSELEILFNYYYQRHVNESLTSKNNLLCHIISTHNILQLEENTWKAFNKILHSVNVYDPTGDKYCNSDFKRLAALYHIIHNKDMPATLVEYLESNISFSRMCFNFGDMNEEIKLKVYNYLYDFYMSRIQKFSRSCNDKNKFLTSIHFLLELMTLYNKTKKDIPGIVLEFIEQNKDSFKYQQILEEKTSMEELTDDILVRYLKKDINLVRNAMPEVKNCVINKWHLGIKCFLKKLKIYFEHDDIVQEFIKQLYEIIALENLNHFTAHNAVYGIIQLSDTKSIVAFMNKFAPQTAKIDHSNIKRNLLETREAICRFMGYARPPVPLANVLLYLKGDYVRFCLPLFNMYLSNLAMPLCIQFVQSLLDNPVSIQKHGLRLAFKCFDKNNLITLVKNTWEKTKNVSIRSVLYKAFYERTVTEKDQEMYETLKYMTLDLNENDDDELFSILTSWKVPNEFAGDFIESANATVDKFKDNEQNLQRKADVIHRMVDIMCLVKKEYLRKIVNDHVNAVFAQSEAQLCEVKTLKHLLQEKWDLTGYYLVFFTNSEQDLNESIEMTKYICRKIFDNWNMVVKDFYPYRKMFRMFIHNLAKNRFVRNSKQAGTFLPDSNSFVNSIPIFETIILELEAALQLNEYYICLLDLKMSIIIRQVIKEMKTDIQKEKKPEVIEKTAVKFGLLVGQFVKTLVDSKRYFTFFIEELINSIKWSSFAFNHHFAVWESNFSKDLLLVAIARGLMELKMMETNILALQILPVDPECNLVTFKEVYNAMRQLPDTEIQCSLTYKYTSDYKRRRFE